MTRALIWTDAPFFSGAENMVATLVGDRAFADEFDLALAYRTSPAYVAGLRERVPVVGSEFPVELPDVPALTDPIRLAPLRAAAKAGSHLVGLKYWFVRTDVARLTALFSRVRPDLLHVNSGGYPGAYSSLAAVIAAKRAGVARVIYVANNIATPYTWRRALDRGIDRRVADGVDAFVTGSTFAGDSLANVLRIERSRVRTLPNGIRPREVVEPPASVRARIGVPQGRPLVAHVAVLEARKGHRGLLRALAALKARGAQPLPFLAIEGVGPEQGALRELVVALGLGGDVAFLGREPRVFDLLDAADIVTLPSVAGEDFPNVVLEAMSLGKPVVANRVAGTPEQIVHGETGLLVEPGDESGLADALATLAGDPVRRAEMGAAGKARFDAHFTARHAVERYRALYRELAPDTAPPTR